MTMQTIYKGHNSPFAVRIKDYDGTAYTAARMATITRATISYIYASGQTAKSADSETAGHEDVFDWITLAATGYMLIDMGNLDLTAGRDTAAELVIYDTAYPAGRMVTLIDILVDDSILGPLTLVDPIPYISIGDLSDVDLTGGVTGDVLTQQEDGSFAMETPTAGEESDPVFSSWLSTTPPAYPGDIPSVIGLLDETAHDLLDHSGITGIPSIAGLLDETAHDALDHTGLTGVLAIGTGATDAMAGNTSIPDVSGYGDIVTHDASEFAAALGDDDNYVTDAEKLNLHAPESDNQDLSGLVEKVTGSSLVADSEISKIHSQNTDTGTTGNTFTIDSDSSIGKIIVDVATGASNNSLTITNAELTGDHTATFQNKTGTIALTSDVPSVAGLLDETSHDALDHAGLTGIHASGSDAETAATIEDIMTGADAVTVIADADTFSIVVGEVLKKITGAYMKSILAGSGLAASMFDANTILAANTDDTPAALAIAEQTVVGRVTGGNIDDLSATQVRTLLNVADGANAYSHPNHSGDVTSSGDGAQTIANSAVTLAKMANMATASVIYRKTAGDGAPEVNTLATLKTDLDIPRTVQAKGSVSGAQTFDLATYGGITITSGGAITVDLTGSYTSGKLYVTELVITNGGAYTWGWASKFRFVGGTAPTLTTSGVDSFTLITKDGGTTCYVLTNGQDVKAA